MEEYTTQKDENSRRKFIQQTAITAVGLVLAPSLLRAAGSPSEITNNEKKQIKWKQENLEI